jgi:hypothetical protein
MKEIKVACQIAKLEDMITSRGPEQPVMSRLMPLGSCPYWQGCNKKPWKTYDSIVVVVEILPALPSFNHVNPWK